MQGVCQRAWHLGPSSVINQTCIYTIRRESFLTDQFMSNNTRSGHSELLNKEWQVTGFYKITNFSFYCVLLLVSCAAQDQITAAQRMMEKANYFLVSLLKQH